MQALLFGILASLSAHAITGGALVKPQEQISKHSVVILDHGRFNCSGTLVAENLVLTAAHCMLSDSNKELKNLSVAFTLPSGAQRKFPVIASRYPQTYLGYKKRARAKNIDVDEGDIGLLLFQGEVPSGFEPAPFLPNASVLKEGAEVIIAGNGPSSINEALKNHVGPLRKVKSSILDAHFGKTEIVVGLESIHKGATCEGDSGGPSYVVVQGKFYLWGVASRGTGDHEDDNRPCDEVSMYTNALSHLEWLEDAAQHLSDLSYVSSR